MAYGALLMGKLYIIKGDEKAFLLTLGIIQLIGSRLFDMVLLGATIKVSSIYTYNR